MKTSALGPWYLSFLIALALIAAPVAASAQTVATFEEDRSIGLIPSTVDGCPIDKGYVGFYWIGFSCQSPWYAYPDLNAWHNTSTGYSLGMYPPAPFVEGQHSATNGIASATGVGSSIFGDGPFDFRQAWVAADLRNDMWLNVWGFKDEVASDFKSILIQATAPTLVDFDFMNVDRVVFGWGAGGTIDPHAYYIQPDDESIRTYRFSIDNVVLSTTVTPEPSTWIMLATGLLGIGFVARHRRRDEDEEVDGNAP